MSPYERFHSLLAWLETAFAASSSCFVYPCLCCGGSSRRPSSAGTPCIRLSSFIPSQQHTTTAGMGWFDWLGGKASDTPEAPLRQDRKRCWESRDAYFACLDAQGVVKPGDEGSACSATKKSFEQNCAKSWVRGVCITRTGG